MFGLSPLPRSLAAALRDANDPKLEVRLGALRDLVRYARSGESEAKAALGRALADPADEVRASAALALADADVQDHLATLVSMAQHDRASRARQFALLALGELGNVGSEALAAALKAACSSDVAAERFQALLSLHQVAPAACEPALLASLVDPDPEVRKLGFRIAEAHYADAHPLPELVRARARSALGGADLKVRAAAALLLGRYGDTSGEEMLLLLLARRVPGASSEDEQAAIDLAGELSLQAARPALARRAFAWLARDPLAYDARIALARMGDARARDGIVRDLDAWTFHARTLAVVAAGRARLTEAKPRLYALLAAPERADAVAVREALTLLGAEPPP